MKRFPLLFLAVFTLLKVMVYPQETEETVYPPQAILNATFMGDIEMMKLILKTNPDRDVRDALGATALHIAIFRGNLEVIRILLDYGFDINAAASNGYTPLHYCVWLNKIEAARFLLLNNADRNIKDNSGMTPLEKATKEAKRDMILALSRR